MLLSEALALWIAQRRVEGYSEDTIKSYRVQLGQLIKHMGDLPVEEMSLALFRAYIGGPASEGRKPGTIAHRVRMIRSFCRWCQEEDILVRNPAIKLKEPKLPKRIRKALAFRQLELVRHACVTPGSARPSSSSARAARKGRFTTALGLNCG